MNLSDTASDEERVGPEPAEHDDKDWTVVIANGCPECSFIGAGPSQLAGLIRESIEFWSDALRRPGATERLHPTVWSPLEYACHLTDLSHVFHERIDAILTQETPALANFDGEQAAIDGRYHERGVDQVIEAYADAAEAVAVQFLRVAPDQWDRKGRRSDGMVFTLSTLGTYYAHELVHHEFDVRRLQGRVQRWHSGRRHLAPLEGSE